MAVNINSDNFDSEVVQSPKPVLLDFWAQWCGPCQMLAPVIGEISSELADKIKVCKVDVDENGELAQEYGIMSIPTLIIIKNGNVIAKTTGNMSKDKLVEFINSNI
ncbi:MAG: thioredoxin [Candidatus Omnitrophica bacterium]|nr:thioredoxin [Candidatus Omnitrophota bacterium]MDD5080940.1 thioredoxin [Candidatus Omnitrophota bacterium]MDD5440583.1 thioredoxin [Candidatus Omnitrophota bacterium]